MKTKDEQIEALKNKNKRQAKTIRTKNSYINKLKVQNEHLLKSNNSIVKDFDAITEKLEESKEDLSRLRKIKSDQQEEVSSLFQTIYEKDSEVSQLEKGIIGLVKKLH